MAGKQTRTRRRVKAIVETAVAEVEAKAPQPTVEAPEPEPDPAPSFASRARRKAALIAEAKSLHTTPERTAEIRAELATMVDVPILSHAELQRLGA